MGAILQDAPKALPAYSAKSKASVKAYPMPTASRILFAHHHS
jgi:hypothetical protein